MEASEVTIEQIMACAKDAGASDVHITVGISPKMRVNGKLMVMPFPMLLPPDTKRICDSMMTVKNGAKNLTEKSKNVDNEAASNNQKSFTKINENTFSNNAEKTHIDTGRI